MYKESSESTYKLHNRQQLSRIRQVQSYNRTHFKLNGIDIGLLYKHIQNDNVFFPRYLTPRRPLLILHNKPNRFSSFLHEHDDDDMIMIFY